MTKCEHKHTGSSSPKGEYLFVVCMDCREILAESELGRKLRLGCPGWEQEGNNSYGHCKHCHHDANYHIKLLTAKLAERPRPWFGCGSVASAGEKHE